MPRRGQTFLAGVAITAPGSLGFFTHVLCCPEPLPFILYDYGTEIRHILQLCGCWWQARSKTSRRVHKCFIWVWKKAFSWAYGSRQGCCWRKYWRFLAVNMKCKSQGCHLWSLLQNFLLQEHWCWNHWPQSCSVVSEKEEREKKWSRENLVATHFGGV